MAAAKSQAEMIADIRVTLVRVATAAEANAVTQTQMSHDLRELQQKINEIAIDGCAHRTEHKEELDRIRKLAESRADPTSVDLVRVGLQKVQSDLDEDRRSVTSIIHRYLMVVLAAALSLGIGWAGGTCTSHHVLDVPQATTGK